ncbi:response regulator [Marinoscillum furvescens]|uniref:CheY-like chemotaxis protein n=1 Tax=Marinoscillum furvescens DSM 4134 TaxID=1122208 RepID=A0A3D9KZB4_MARFU|nr:response regulator [Marinoscillum furvescens]RED95639.1 CheY-like chemotaxis protein [Marinoscillum furvescens DSM 4134]
MTTKLKSILLIDDDKATNFIHEILINKMECTEKIVVKNNGLEALEYLESRESIGDPQPDLIFLDINMPKMNGWEFLEEYEKLENRQKGRVILMMLTTSPNPADMDRARDLKAVNGFKNKPLTKEMLTAILEEHFANQM